MLNRNKDDKKLNVSKLNDLVGTGKKILNILYVLFIIVLIYVVSLIFKEWGILSFVGKILSILAPFFVGFIIAWMLNPIVKKLVIKKVKRPLAVIITYVGMIIVIYVILALTLPSLTNQISEIVTAIPDIVSDINAWINNFFLKLSNMTLQNLDSVKSSFLLRITNFATEIEKNLPTTAVNIVSSLASGIGNILMSLIIGIYVLFDYDKICESFISVFPKNIRKDVEKLFSRLSAISFSFVSGTLWLSLLLFVVSIIGFSIIGLNAPVLIAFVCVITNLIPYIGPYIGAAVAAAIGFAESPLIGILSLVFILVVQTIDGNLLQPLVMSKKMNLSPIVIILSLLVFGYFWGIFGMIIATPLIGIIKTIYEFFDEKYHFFDYKEKED